MTTKASLRWSVALLYLYFAGCSADVAARRLQISALTIRLASATDKDGLTFTGNYPSNVLSGQELKADTQLSVSFEVTSHDGDRPVSPQQCFLMVAPRGTEMATYLVAKPSGGQQTVSTDVKYILQQLGQHERIELSLIVGDPRFPEGVVWNLGSVELAASLAKEMGIADPLLPRRLHRHEVKPEIQHLFREPDARPPAVVSLFFVVLSICPLIAWLLYVQKLGINLRGLPSAASRGWVMLFHTGLALTLVLYALFFFRLNLIQMIVPLSCLCVFCFFTGHQTLCAVAGTSPKEKMA